jgi:Ca-activated chloride channel family protein
MRAGWLALVAMLSVSAAIVRSQPDRPQFAARTDVVVLHATVKDRNGGYVTGLTKDAFSIVEGGQPQTISLFAAEDAPVTAGLILDNSGSMQPHRDRLIAAALGFAATSNPRDELFALAFDEDVRAVLPDVAPFTSDIPTLRNALARALGTRGRTALFDALAAGLRYVDRGHEERKVLVVVSDGGDNASHTTFRDVLATAQASNALIYTVAIVDSIDRDNNPKLLKQLAEATGGEGFTPGSIDEVGDVLKHIARDIRHTYTIGYVSSNAARDGTYRPIRLVVQPPPGTRVQVRTRAGYVAAADREQERR